MSLGVSVCHHGSTEFSTIMKNHTQSRICGRDNPSPLRGGQETESEDVYTLTSVFSPSLFHPVLALSSLRMVLLPSA